MNLHTHLSEQLSAEISGTSGTKKETAVIAKSAVPVHGVVDHITSYLRTHKQCTVVSPPNFCVDSGTVTMKALSSSNMYDMKLTHQDNGVHIVIEHH